MLLPYVYRVTKYDPADRDEHEHYTGAEGSVSDHGEIEAACLQAVEAFAAEAGVGRLSVREPQVPSLVHFGVERPLDGFGLEGLLPVGYVDRRFEAADVHERDTEVGDMGHRAADNLTAVLVHNSELADELLDNPQLGIQVGDALPVKILDIDPVRRRITLSHRQAVSEA